jgi:hypothetical protein
VTLFFTRETMGRSLEENENDEDDEEPNNSCLWRYLKGKGVSVMSVSPNEAN